MLKMLILLPSVCIYVSLYKHFACKGMLSKKTQLAFNFCSEQLIFSGQWADSQRPWIHMPKRYANEHWTFLILWGAIKTVVVLVTRAQTITKTAETIRKKNKEKYTKI